MKHPSCSDCQKALKKREDKRSIPGVIGFVCRVLPPSPQIPTTTFLPFTSHHLFPTATSSCSCDHVQVCLGKQSRLGVLDKKLGKLRDEIEGREVAVKEREDYVLRVVARVKKECSDKLMKQEAKLCEEVKKREVAVKEREDNVLKVVEKVKREYSGKLRKQEAKIRDCLHKQGYAAFEYVGGGVVMSHVLEAELKGRDDIINEMKDTVMEAQQEKASLAEQRVFLSKRKLDVDKEEKKLDSKLKKEKTKRFKLEMKIKGSLQRQNFVVLESGGVLTTPSHIQVEMKVREEQLSSTIEKCKSKDIVIAGSLASLAAQDKVLSVKEQQLAVLRKKRKHERQCARRREKSELHQQTTGYLINSPPSLSLPSLPLFAQAV